MSLEIESGRHEEQSPHLSLFGLRMKTISESVHGHLASIENSEKNKECFIAQMLDPCHMETTILERQKEHCTVHR